MKKILIIEDQINFSRPLEKQLSKKSYNVSVVQDFKEANIFLEENKDIEIILTDFQTPKGNLDEFVAKNLNLFNSNNKVVLMSGYLESDIMEKVDNVKNDLSTKQINLKYIKKPFTLKQLLEKFEV